MKIYVVGIETSYDYRKFPWIKKSRGYVSLKANMRTIVAKNTEEAEQKYRKLCSNKMVVAPALHGLVAEGLWPVMCKDPKEKSKLYIRELDPNAPLGEYVEYMTPADLALLKQPTTEES